MEGLPTVMSVIDSGGGGGGGGGGIEIQDNLAFALSEGENGLNYGYIIHLPVDIAMQQELLGNVLSGGGGDHQNHLIVHHHQLESKNSTQQSTIYLPVVTTTSASNTTTNAASTNNCGDTTETVVHNHHHPQHPPPIEFQYHLEEIPSSAFIDGQVQVEMSAEVDVKYDTLNFTSVQLQEEPQSLNHQVNFNEDLVVSDILSENLDTSIITTTAAVPQISQVNSNNSPTSILTKATSTHAAPNTTARTYGKPKPIKVIKEEPSQIISQDIKLLPSPVSVPPSSSSSISPLKVTKVNQVSVVKSQRVSAPIAIRKRRLIIDAQRQIPIPEFKRQLLNTKDIVSLRSELAPGTKQAMKCLEVGGVVQFFSTPGRTIRNVRLSRLFTNHLVMISNSVGHHHCSSGSSAGAAASTSTFNVGPLSADLRVPAVLKDEDERISNPNFSKGHNSQFNNVPSTAYKRLVNLSRPLECLFKGLRKPPVFKEYKKIQRKLPPGKMNGRTGGGGGGGLKMFHNRHKNKVKDKMVEDKQEEEGLDKGKVEEVVYTVVEEEGESVVLKSSGDAGAEVEDDHVDTGDERHCMDPLLLQSLKKEMGEVDSDNIFIDNCTTASTTFSMVNGENDDDDAGEEGVVDEDDLNKLLWSSEQVTTTLSS